MQNTSTKLLQLDQIAARKEHNAIAQMIAALPDSFTAWIECYINFTVLGVRNDEIADKIILHLSRFATYFQEQYGQERISHCLKRDAQAWQTHLSEDWAMAASTVNNHLASLSAFCTWVHAQAPHLFAAGDPTKGVRELPLPPLEPRTLSEEQVRSLKNTLDRLPTLYEKKGRRYQKRKERLGVGAQREIHAHKRPYRDRAMAYVLLSTGVRREELVNLNLDQLEPNTADALRSARRARIVAVKGKNRSQRTLYLSADARQAVADYLEKERPKDAQSESTALFLRAATIADLDEKEAEEVCQGRLANRSINRILLKIGRLHDVDFSEEKRRISPLHPHALRHTFGNMLAKVTQADEYELERRLGHHSRRYIKVYTNPPEQVAATYVESF